MRRDGSTQRRRSPTPPHRTLEAGRDRASALTLAELADRLEPLLVYAWRRHLAARRSSRMLRRRRPPALEPGRCGGSSASPTWSTSPRLVRRLSERQLAGWCSGSRRWPPTSSPRTAAGSSRPSATRSCSSTVGAAAAAAIALDLVDTMSEDDAAAGRARAAWPAARALAARRRVRHHRQPGQPAHHLAPARARAGRRRTWPRRSRASSDFELDRPAPAHAARHRGRSPRSALRRALGAAAAPPTDPHAIDGSRQESPYADQPRPRARRAVTSGPVSTTSPSSCSTDPRR